ATCVGNAATVHGVGFASPLLYAVASVPAEYATSFNDIKSGNNDQYGIDKGLTFPATTGYDMASGLGSPQLTAPGGEAGLAFYLCALGASATRPTVLDLAPKYGSTAGNFDVTLTGSGFKTGATDNVANVTINGVEFDSSHGLNAMVTSATTITLLMPPASLLLPPVTSSDGAGPANITVTLTNGESSTANASSMFEYVDENGSSQPVPAVTGVDAPGGSQAGGNVVTIYGSGFYASGPQQTTGVTFGGVSAPVFTVVSEYEIQATVPAYSGSNSVCSGGLPAGENASNDMCQVQVVVTSLLGSSHQYPISPPYEGAINISPEFFQIVPPNCGCEILPGPSEYDYGAPVTITDVSTSHGPSSLANANGSTLVTVTGTGFNFNLLDWVYTGPAGQASIDPNVSYATGTSIQFTVSGGPLGTDAQSEDLSILALAGTSNVAQLQFAGVPQVDTLTSATAELSTGGGTAFLGGKGFADATYASFQAVDNPYTGGTSYNFTVTGDGSMAVTMPSMNQGLVYPGVCTNSGCAYLPQAITLYPPGNPSISGVTVASGPAHGGTQLQVTGTNLSFVTNVRFGTTEAASFSNVPALLEGGMSTVIDVTAPPGVAGTKEPITVDTVEGAATGSGPVGNPAAAFTYLASTPSAPAPVNVLASGGSLATAWTIPASDGGSLVTGYRITASSPGRNSVSDTTGPSAESYEFPYMLPGVPWTVTVTAVNSLGAGLPASSVPTTVPLGDNGYLIASMGGPVLGFGSLQAAGGVGGQPLPSPIVGIAATPDALGYYELAANGSVYAFGDATLHEGAPLGKGEVARGIATTPDGRGYWIVSNLGHVFTFGDARYFGNADKSVTDVVGIAATTDGGGYWIAEATGNVFALGDAAPLGGPPAHLNKPVDGIATYGGSGGPGYWLVAVDGGVFTYGSAKFRGSMQGLHLNKPC
ncbi:MAG TPA: IPT/TIG domain-containing protein, partial [Acidimicrobiales bacterium]|nr:IPT/TIG domain-containing protein [Acidimicrobiales bacterium]